MACWPALALAVSVSTARPLRTGQVLPFSLIKTHLESDNRSTRLLIASTAKLEKCLRQKGC